MEINSGKHLYSRGWLGLIPLIGGIAGIILIILGAFKYRDRKLIFIGFAAFTFTVLIYSSIYYYFNYSQSAKKSFASFAQPAMNNLLKNIEFYKTEHRGYPQKLTDLLKEDKLVQIFDPIPGKPKSNNGEFYYKKLDTTYYLFSAGIDRKPFTSDDIFPSESFFSNKTGLVRPIQ